MKGFFQVRLLTKYSRLTDTFPSADGEFYRSYIASLQRKFDTLSKEIMSPQLNFVASAPGKIEDILNKLLPKDDSSVIFDQAKSGVTDDLVGTFNELYFRLVEYYLQAEEKGTRSDEDVWITYSKPLREQRILTLLAPHTIRTENDTLDFEYAYKNGRWSLLQPISFDLMSAYNIKKKARLWLGNQMVLKNSKEELNLYLLLGKPNENIPALAKAYNQAKDILTQESVDYNRNLVEEDEAADFAKEVSGQFKH
jgi:hypothetical protein